MEDIELATGNLLLFLGAIVIAIWAWGSRLEGRSSEPLALRVPLFNLGVLLWALMMVYLLLPQLGFGLAGHLFADESGEENLRILLATLFGQIGLLLALLVFFESTRPQGMSFPGLISVSGGQSLRLALIYWGRALPLVWLVSLVWNGMLWLINYLGFELDLVPQDAALWIAGADSVYFLIFAALMVIVLAPVVEEIFFRGFLYPVLAARFNERVAFFASSLLFGLVHANLQNFLALTLLGCLLAYAYRQTRDIRVPIFFHALFNAFTFANLFFIDLK